MSEAVPVRYGDRLTPRAGSRLSRVCEVRAGERADWEWLVVRRTNRAGLPQYSNGGTWRLIGGASEIQQYVWIYNFLGGRDNALVEQAPLLVS